MGASRPNVVYRGFRYRLDPTPEQAEKFSQFAGVCRLIYNAALWQREHQWRQFRENTGRRISFASQCRELTALRAEVPWSAEVPSACQQQALRDLDDAFRHFFSGGTGYPKPRRKGADDTFRFYGREVYCRKLSAKWSAVKLPKVGLVRFRDTRPMAGRLLNATISLRSGHWHISFACEIEHEAVPSDLPSVGIDRGVANTLTLSTGEHFRVPASLDAIERCQRRARRILSRRKRGSARYAKQRRRVAAMSARCARIRKDWQHRVTTDVAQRFGTVVIEDLKIANMTASGRGKRGLNRAILNQGWGALATMLAYKLEERGGSMIRVNPAFTSQQCSDCGAVDSKSRKSQAVFKCVHCGHEAHADINAAINIKRLGSTQSLLVEASGYGAVEARTVNHGEISP